MRLNASPPAHFAQDGPPHLASSGRDNTTPSRSLSKTVAPPRASTVETRVRGEGLAPAVALSAFPRRGKSGRGDGDPGQDDAIGSREAAALDRQTLQRLQIVHTGQQVVRSRRRVGLDGPVSNMMQ